MCSIFRTIDVVYLYHPPISASFYVFLFYCVIVGVAVGVSSEWREGVFVYGLWSWTFGVAMVFMWNV